MDEEYVRSLNQTGEEKIGDLTITFFKHQRACQVQWTIGAFSMTPKNDSRTKRKSQQNISQQLNSIIIALV